MNRKRLIFVVLLSLGFALQTQAEGAEKKAKPKKVKKADSSTPKKLNEEIDVSGLEEEYWRPQVDELEAVQNKRFVKDGRFEVTLLYGAYQGGDFLERKAWGGAIVYHFDERWAVEIAGLQVNNKDTAFLQSVKQQFAFSPDTNPINSQYRIGPVWTPIYAKFALLGKKVSHFETYISPGVGFTDTTESHFTWSFSIGEKFFLTNNLLLRVEWNITVFDDKIPVTTGSQSTANGGPGFIETNETKHNLLFGIGWLF